jgi:Protein of unknown function (DUF1638)
VPRQSITPTKDAPRVVIACKVMEPEIASLTQDMDYIRPIYMASSLHHTPDTMPERIGEQIHAAASYASQIVLGYGLCSNGVVGLKAPQQGLIIPRVHDCISLFLGSGDLYQELFNKRPGTYYLTPGWIAERSDPLGYLEDSYVPKMGRERAEWGLKEELKHYTHITLINTDAADMAPLRKIAQENADFLDMAYEEVPGSSSYFSKILFGPYTDADFVCLEPGAVMQQDMIVG